MTKNQNVYEDISKFKVNFDSACKEIEKLAELSEPEFISLGEKLMNISSLAENVSQIAFQIAEMLFGNTSSDLNTNLQYKLKVFDRYFSFKVSQLSKIWHVVSTMMESISNFNGLSIGFKKLLRNFNNHVISMRIENERLIDQNTHFSVLGKEVAELLDDALIQLNSIDETINLVNANADSLSSSIQYLKTESLPLVQKRLFPFRELSAELWNEHKKWGGVFHDFSTKMDDTFKKINEIVVSLQFHDIARQKIEHIVDGIKSFVGNGTFKDNFENDDEFKNKCCYINSFSELQSSQLNLTKNEIYSEISKITEKLSSISENTNAVKNETLEIVDFIKNSVDAKLKNSKNLIELIFAALEEATSKIDEITLLIKTTVKNINPLIETIHQINEIGLNIQLKALNGLIHASRMNKEGAALRVITNSMGNLSESTKLFSENFIDILKEIKKSTSQISNAFKGGTDKQDKKFVQYYISSDLSSFYQRLKYVNNATNEKFIEVSACSNSLTNQINEIQSNITVGDLFQKQVNSALSQLDEIIVQTNEYGNIDNSASALENLEDLKKNYTISSEHNILKDFINKSTGTNHNNNELFSPNNEENEASDEDDNIDLF